MDGQILHNDVSYNHSVPENFVSCEESPFNHVLRIILYVHRGKKLTFFDFFEVLPLHAVQFHGFVLLGQCYEII
jgi:hypothetical protein